MVSGEA